ncbi:MAG: DUF5666 domain-containing protein [Pseudomonadota bacterium]
MNRKVLSTEMGAVAVAVAVALSGCGGGGDTASSSTGATSTSAGVITGFGSVYVNGVEYETDSATITVDGAVVNGDQDLAVGMTAEVSGSVNPDGTTGIANAINVTDELEGVVLSNNVGTDGTMNIMGMTVTVTALTVFESDVAGIPGVEAVEAGNVAEVSGYSSGEGDVYATRIEVKAADLASYLAEHADELELKGVVADLDSGAQTFTIGSLIVDYAGAGYVSSELRDGLYVEVKSESAPVDNGDGTFTLAATKVEKEDDGILGISGDEGDEIELEGIVTNIDEMPASFALNGQSILINNETEFEDGLDPAAIAVGDGVEVEGYFNASGQLVADSVEMEDDDNLSEYKEYIQSIDMNNSTLTLQVGDTITINSSTIMLDNLSDIPEHYFDLSDLRSGDYLEIHATVDAEGNLTAVKLERKDPSVI